jgi:hypothetical protein
MNKGMTAEEILLQIESGELEIFGSSKETNITYNNVESIVNNNIQDNIQNNTQGNTQNNTQNNIQNSNNSPTIATKTSSKSNPLKLNEWGVASRYSNGENVNVPISVTKITRGNSANQIVKDYCDNSSIYKYEEPKSGTEYVVVEYTVDLSPIMDEYGVRTRVSSDLVGTGEYDFVTYNGYNYSISTNDISGYELIKTKTGNGKFAATLPIGCTDYLIKFGEYNGTAAYFVGK